MKLAGFERWLKETMGLDASTIGPTIVDRALRERMAAAGSADLAGYWQTLRASPLEQQELIETVVVPETWFFRDREAFAALAQRFGPGGSGERTLDRLRLLSLPCSTGEEPYTMAMAMLDAGLPGERLAIDAVDISERALAKARRAVYGNNSFRGSELQYRERHFSPVPGGWQLGAAARERVNFQQGNVLDIGFLPGEAVYDAVFCRNLLIYFDPPTQARTVAVLDRLLRPDGLMFVGPAETGLMLSLGFVSAQLPMAFAFRKPAANDAAVVPAAATAARPLPKPLPAKAAAPAPAKPRPRVAPAPAAIPAATPAAAPAANAAPLQIAQRAADDGRFDEAIAICQAQLREHGPSVEALYLLGLVLGAIGQATRAEDSFRKVLYLDPAHEETLMHLALLLDAKGDAAGARVLRSRAQRHRKHEIQGGGRT
ncbi:MULTISPECIES: CheR family methyltransferase [Lysobacter]|uniref:CheR family methyltransferase n=1 Tax=Lysobacter firmicutimachus TaxID=1792846 RepID=A0ABU8D3R1_9GAMM|nr:protein-glutamate O-methyltransferase CheR [Lysobacter antibioticus]